jgi:hypothetical protein
MSHHIVEYDCACEACKATGLYVGMAERDGFAVVCHTCKGTGKKHVRYEYDDFDGRQFREKVKRVLQSNPGICCGTGNGHKLTDFGGLPYGEWLEGQPFTTGTEMRQFTCPAWWYQGADYKKKPDWEECNQSWGRRFSDCSHFCTKSKCWERWDKEFGGKP